MQVTFHRAFDRCRNPFEALEQLIEIGCDRLLTSGQRPNVVDGVGLVAELNRMAAGRIAVMPGSGVRPENAAMLAQVTGCTELHASLRTHERSAMEFIHPAFAESSEDYINNSIKSAEVRALRNALNAIAET
jgi:copper homeostasis protein